MLTILFGTFLGNIYKGKVFLTLVLKVDHEAPKLFKIALKVLLVITFKQHTKTFLLSTTLITFLFLEF